MRLPLTPTGLPFSTQRIVQDYRGALQGTPWVPRYVTVYAWNTNFGSSADITAELLTPGGTVQLPTVSVPELPQLEVPITVLDTFPLVGEVALQISPSAGLMVFGFVTFGDGEGAIAPTVFSTASAIAPFVAPTPTFDVDSGEVVVHALRSQLQEISLMIDIPDSSGQLELRVYSDANTYEAFVFEGLRAATQLFDRIPMYSPGSIRVVALNGPYTGQFAAYGTTILR